MGRNIYYEKWEIRGPQIYPQYEILQARLQQYVNRELPDIQAGFRKGRGTRDQIANICWIMEKAMEFQKNIYFCFIDHAKSLTVWITINCGKFWKRWEYQTTWSASWEICIQVRKQQLELDMEQQTGSKYEVHHGYILSLCLFNLYAEYIMRHFGLDEAQAGIKITGRNINNLRYADDTIHSSWKKAKKNWRASWWKWKRRVKKLA